MRRIIPQSGFHLPRDDLHPSFGKGRLGVQPARLEFGASLEIPSDPCRITSTGSPAPGLRQCLPGKPTK